ncbi:MAG: hypothetical protein IKD73_03295 [Selenomonadaceae bacterium]|nr:hypothetical protein [Selenomonadaceae bacterium]
MFEDGAKIDDILDVLKRPALNASKQRESELKHDSGQSSRDEIQLEFGQKTLEVLR